MSDKSIFISYPHQDASWAREFADALRKESIDVWFDEWEIKPGDALLEKIEGALRASDAIVAILTRGNVSRPNVFFEIGVALGAGKRLIAVVSPDIPPAELPANVRMRSYLTREDPARTAQRVAEALKEPS